jgi:hypothetical protein
MYTFIIVGLAFVAGMYTGSMLFPRSDIQKKFDLTKFKAMEDQGKRDSKLLADAQKRMRRDAE